MATETASPGVAVAGNSGGAGTSPAVQNSSALPFTGAEIGLLSAAGIGLVAGGAAIVIAGRRRRQADGGPASA